MMEMDLRKNHARVEHHKGMAILIQMRTVQEHDPETLPRPGTLIEVIAFDEDWERHSMIVSPEDISDPKQQFHWALNMMTNKTFITDAVNTVIEKILVKDELPESVKDGKEPYAIKSLTKERRKQKGIEA